MARILIVGGFLGSGKTSVIMRLAKYLTQIKSTAKIAIIENEIGEVQVDGSMIEQGGFTVQNLFSGCVCCTLSGELFDSIRQIEKELDPDIIVLEATGVAIPGSIKEKIVEYLGADVRVCCVADAKRWMRIYRALEQLVIDQLSDADCILINKIDNLDEETLEKVEESIRKLTGGTDIYRVSALDGISPDVLKSIAE